MMNPDYEKEKNDRIKVLVVCGSLGVGGAEVQTSRLVPRLNRDIFDVQVAYYVPESGFPKQALLDGGIKVTCLSGKQWDKRRFFKASMYFMRREKFDLVHAVQDSDNHYARIPAILSGVPVVIGGLRGARGLKGRWVLLYSLMNFRCAGWIVNSRKLKELAEKRMYFMRRSPIKIIRNGIEIESERDFNNQEITYYDNLKTGKPVVGIVGRLHPVKNHLLFVEMARQLTAYGVDADYWIIGDGEMRSEIERTVADFGLSSRVKLLGLCEDVDVALSRIDVCVLTSNSESCPNALLEAMRASLPVISTKCTSLEDIIEEGLNGFTVNLGDVGALVEKVSLVLSDKEKLKEMGRHSRHIIEERFSISTAVNDLEEAYLYFLKRKSDYCPRLKAKLDQVRV